MEITNITINGTLRCSFSYGDSLTGVLTITPSTLQNSSVTHFIAAAHPGNGATFED